mmetsp:Transcript_1532/g.3330  ORF Transcript_1532/g.3330 Transcript_1532/m.3330 type:complete len:439 (+) Transcript_1532:120-1436(+)
MQRQDRRCNATCRSLVGGHLLDQDVLQRTKHLAEGQAAHGKNLGRIAADHDTGGSRLILEQSKLAKVVASLVVHDLNLPIAVLLRGIKRALLHDVKLVPRFLLLDDHLRLLVRLRLQGIGNLRALIVTKRGNQGDILEEAVVFRPTLHGGILDYVVERFSVQLPAHAFVLCNNGSCSRAVVKQCKLSEDVAGDARLDHLLYALNLLDAIQRPFLNNEQVVSILTFGDHLLARVEDYLLHGHQYGFHVLWLQLGEHEALLECLVQPVLLVVGLRVLRCRESLLLVPGPIRLSTDGLASPPHLCNRLLEALWDFVQFLLVVVLLLLLLLGLSLLLLLDDCSRLLERTCDVLELLLEHRVLLCDRDPHGPGHATTLPQPLDHEIQGTPGHLCEHIAHHFLEDWVEDLQNVLLLVIWKWKAVNDRHASQKGADTLQWLVRCT